jgi:hypothetical protein
MCVFNGESQFFTAERNRERAAMSALKTHIFRETNMADKDLNDLFLDTLKDIYFAEKQIYKNLPKMAKAANSMRLPSLPTARSTRRRHNDWLEAAKGISLMRASQAPGVSRGPVF